MSENKNKYNITDDNLHKFIVASHSFIEEYSELYSKIFILDTFVHKIDDIDFSDIDKVDVFTSCIFDLCEDVYNFSNSLYLKSKKLNFDKYRGA